MELPLRTKPISEDSALIIECLSGNTNAFTALMARHRNGVYNFIRHTIGSETDAQDLAQDVFISAFAALRRFRLDAPFEPWIYKIAANSCRSYFRKRATHPAGLDYDYVARTTAAPEVSDPAARVEKEMAQRELVAAVQALPPEQRMVIILKHIQDQSYEQIAASLGIPVSTVDHRLRAARQTLRRRIGEPEPRKDTRPRG
jgi:RNA polymerase sigma-70 factor (ECF subfamily)